MAGKDGKDGGDDGDFTLAVLQAFQQDCVVQQLQKIFKSSIAPLEDALRQMNETNAALRRQIADRDEAIRKLQVRVTKLELKSDDNEQQGRKGSIRIFGLPEQGQGTLEQKLMRLCNDHLKLQPPICENDIEVAHRLGKPPPNPQPHDESNDPPADADTRADAAPRNPSVRPRAVLIKLASPRTKGHIMDARSKLKNNPYIQDNISYAVYIGDDLTKRRATLAFRARKLRGEGLIQDTWVTNCKIWVKDNRGRITQIYVEDDLKKFNPR